MKKNKLTAIIGTVLIHLLILLILLLIHMTLPKQEEEGGVSVMMGEVEQATGADEPYQLTEVDVVQQTASSQPEEAVKAPLLTQNEEPSLQVKKQSEKQKGTKKQVSPNPVQPKEVKKEVKDVAPRKTADEIAAEEAANRIARAFGKGSKMGSRGDSDTGKGTQGSREGNSTSGKTSGVGGYGTFDLNGRSLGSGSLPVPTYNVQDEGRVVVTIVVNPSGQVISTSINKRTNTTNPALRRAAEEAARQARFNEIDGVNNQSGTITYYFRLR